MVGVPAHFANVKAEGTDERGQVAGRRLNERVWRRHLSPEFRLDGADRERTWHQPQSVGDEVVRADVRRVPVGLMRVEDGPGPMAIEDAPNDVNHALPPARLRGARFRVDALQPGRAGAFQAEPDALAAVLQFSPAGSLPVAIAAE